MDYEYVELSQTKKAGSARELRAAAAQLSVEIGTSLNPRTPTSKRLIARSPLGKLWCEHVAVLAELSLDRLPRGRRLLREGALLHFTYAEDSPMTGWIFDQGIQKVTLTFEDMNGFPSKNFPQQVKSCCGCEDPSAVCAHGACLLYAVALLFDDQDLS